MPAYVAQRLTISLLPGGAGLNDGPESVMVHAANATDARAEAAKMLGCPEHDVQVKLLSEIPLP